MANIELNVVALGDFSVVNDAIAKLKANIASLNASLAGATGASFDKTAASVKTLSNEFSSALTNSGLFTNQTVSLQNETEKFGQALQKGTLSLGTYYQILTKRQGEATDSVKALAVEQTKLQNSVIMADPSKSGFYSVFTPKSIDAVANATKIAANQQNIYNLALRTGSNELINWGKNTQWAGRQLTVGMAIPLMVFGQQAVSAFDSVNSALTQLQKVYGEGLTPPSQDSINQISQQVLDLGKSMAATLGISQEFTVQVATQFAAMGKQGQDLLTITEQTDRLAKLGNLDQTTATNAVIALQNVYKMNTTELADAVNYFGAMQKQTSLSMSDLVQSESRIGPIIEELGGTYKDSAVMVLAMKEAGVPAAKSANALKAAMASIINPTSAATKEFASFGINLNNIKDQKGPVNMILALQEALKPLSKMQQEQLIDKLFGKYQFGNITALIQNLGTAGSQTVNALQVANATSGQLATLANQEITQVTSSPSAQWQKALATFKADLYPIGQDILKLGTKLLEFGNKVSKVFQGLPGPVKFFLGLLAGLTVIAGPLLMLTGLMANFVGNILKGVINLKDLISGGKSLRQLLTPELIAAQNASSLFADGIKGDIDQVQLLTQAITDLTAKLQIMQDQMNIGAGIDSLKSAVGATAQVETSIFEQMALPGFADGGIISGPGSGTSDSILARVSNGETILTAEQTRKNAGVITDIILGREIPGYMAGNVDEEDLGPGEYLAHHKSDIPTKLANIPGLMDATSGDYEKIQNKLSSSFEELGKLFDTSFDPKKWIGQIRTNLSHFTEGISNWTKSGTKIYRSKELYGLSGIENAPLSTFSSHFKNGKENDPVRDYYNRVIESVKGDIDEADIEHIKNGGQPITEAQQLLWSKITGRVKQDIISTVNTGSPVTEGDMPLLETVQKGPRKGKFRLKSATSGGYGEGGALFAAHDVVEARRTGELNPVEAMRLDNWAPGKNAPGDSSEKYVGALERQINVLKTSNPQNIEAIKKAESQLQNAIEAAKLDGYAEQLKDLEEAGKKETQEYKNIAQQIAAGIDQGITDSLVHASDTSKQYINGILEEMQSTARIHSSLRLFADEVGEPIGQGITQGIQSSMSSTGSAIHEELLSFIPQIESFAPMTEEASQQIGNSMLAGITVPLNTLGGAVQEKFMQMAAQITAEGPALTEAIVAPIEAANVEIQDMQMELPLSSWQTPDLTPQVGPMMANGGFYSNEIAPGISGTAEEAANADAEATSKLAKAKESLLNKVKKEDGSLRGSVKGGLGMATMMGGQAIAQALPQGSVLASAATNVGTYAGMGMMFGPEGAAVGAAIGGVVTAFQAISTSMRQSSNAIKSSFTTSAEAAQQFNVHFEPLAVYDFAKPTDGLSKHTQSISDNMGAVEKLTQAYLNSSNQMDKDALAKLKGDTKDQALTASLETVAADTSTGQMNFQEALADAISRLTAAGAGTEEIMQIKNEIIAANAGKSGKDTNDATGLFGAYNAGNVGIGNNGEVLTMDDKNINAAGMGQTLLQLTQTGLANTIAQFVQMSKESPDSYKKLLSDQAVYGNLANQVQGDNAWQDAYTAMATNSKTGQDTTNVQALTEAMAEYNSGYFSSAGHSVTELEDAMKKGPDALEAFVKENSAAITKWQADNTAAVAGNPPPPPPPTPPPTGLGGVPTGTPQEKTLQAQIQTSLDAQNAQLKIVKDQLTTQQKIAAEAKAQLQYQQQITGLQNDMKTAMISGNYLQAATLKQQISGAKVDFNASSVQQKLQDQSDAMSANADAINQGLQDLKNAIANGITDLSQLPASVSAAKALGTINAQAVSSGIATGQGPTVTTVIQVTGTVTGTSTTSSHPNTTSTVQTTNVNPLATKINPGNTGSTRSTNMGVS